MFATLPQQPTDPLLDIMRLYAADARSDKIDIGVGMYRDETGATPVLNTVKEAERRLLESETSKGYQGMDGDRVFLARFGAFLLGERAAAMASVQTIGGTGAVRLACELLHEAGARRIWVGMPTWPNHQAIIDATNLPSLTYRYVDMAAGRVDFASLRETLAQVEPGDAVLLHGCCHNPTGAGLTLEQWQEIGRLLAERGAIPLIDQAYTGLGKGLREDLAGPLAVLDAVPEGFLAASCSKCFALYRDRIGALFVKTATGAKEAVQSNLETLARISYSMPAAHGAAIVATILGDAGLTAQWLAELDGMRARIAALRTALGAALAPFLPQCAAVAEQEGMFSTLPVTPAQVARLREEHGIYMAGSGRINVAGLKEADIARFAAAVKAVLETA